MKPCLHPALRWWLMLVLILAGTAHARTLDILAGDTERDAGTYLDLLEDPSGNADIDSIRTRHDWTANTTREPNLGFTASAWWARLSLHVDPSRQTLWYLQVNDAILNQLDIWFELPDGQLIHKTGGGWIPVDERDTRYRTHTFQIPAKGHPDITVYLRARSELAVVLPIRIFDAQRFAEINTLETWIYALYFGFVGSMLLFNLVVWLRMEEKANLLYCGFCGSLLMLSLSFSGMGHQFIWTHTPGADNVILPIACATAAIFATTFTETFLFESSDYRPPLMRERRITMYGLTLSSVLTSAIGFPHAGIQLAAVACLLGTLNFFFNTALAHRNQIRNTRLLLAAWSGIMIGVIIFSGRGFGIFPSNTLTTNAMQISSMFECFLLVVALIEKSRIMRDDLAKANAEAISILETQVQERTASLRDAQQRIVNNERMQALSTFTAGVAHEINNPANFVSAGAQNALSQIAAFQAFIHELLTDDAAPDVRTSLDDHVGGLRMPVLEINIAARHIGRIVKTLRSLNPEGYTGLLPTDLDDVIENALRLMQDVFPPGTDVVRHYDAGTKVPCRVAELHQALMALLNNAADAMHDSNARRLTVSTLKEDDNVIIRIEDTGGGFSDAIATRMFEPFFTTKAQGTGAGLGLSTVRDVAAMHGGRIDAHSQPGKGSTFTLSLPLSSGN